MAELLNVTENETDSACSNERVSKFEDKANTAVEVATATVSLLALLAAIVLVLATKSYKEFLHQLILCMSTAGFIHLLTDFVLVFLKEGSIESQVVLFLNKYFHLLYGLFTCWIGFYVFLLAVLGRTVKKARHKVTGLIVTLVLPLTIVWIVFLRNEVVRFDCSLKWLLIYTCAFAIPFLISSTLSTMTVVAVIVFLCRGAVSSETLNKLHKQAIIEILPFLMFGVLQNISAAVKIFDFALRVGRKDVFLYGLIRTLFYPFPYIAIPLMLLSQPHIQQKLKRNSNKSQSRSNNIVSNNTYNVTCSKTEDSQQQLQVSYSYTHYNVPPETSYTEQDSLVIRQS